MKQSLPFRLRTTVVPMLAVLALPVPAAGPAAGSPPICVNAVVQPTSDYSYAVGGADFSDADGDAEAGSLFRWWKNGSPLAAAQPVGELLRLHFDGSSAGAQGETPSRAQGLAYGSGRWGQALALESTGSLQYPRLYNYDPAEGTIEMWIALQADGSDPVYSSRGHTLFQYRVDSGNWMSISQSSPGGILYAGGTVNGQWESAYGSRGDMRGWKAGEWHHLAFTYSVAGNFMRFYVDGVLAASTNEHHYWSPPATADSIAVGGPLTGQPAAYFVDEVRITASAASGEEIAARARRLEAPRSGEVWLLTAGLSPGDLLTFEFTPATASEAGSACLAQWLYPGIPVTNPKPPSTILAPGSGSLALSVTSVAPTSCAFSLGSVLPFARMTPFSQGSGTTLHHTTIEGLGTDPNQVNRVYVRCASHADFLLPLQYRVRAAVNPSFPRTGNLWGWWQLAAKGLPYMSRLDLWLGADPSPEQTRELRRLNPNILILSSINAVENDGLPDSYYLKDTSGRKIEVWPGSFRLNLTQSAVAEYQAHYAYQRMLDAGMLYDGMFFDNVMTTQSWLKYDIYGNRVYIDANGDGLADEAAALDAAWKQGVFHEIQTFRELMPDALVSSHSTDISEPGVADLFNGNSLGFVAADVLEGEMSFATLWDRYQAWMSQAKAPPITMFEASPPDQIAYGYDYSPLQKIPASTLEFARTLYPFMRFGLALTLMHDGYFAYEFGDTWHGNDWWYDELDFELGYPLGAARRADLGFDIGPNRIEAGGFEIPLASPWKSWVDIAGGYSAAVERDTTTAAEGSASLRITVTQTAGVDWRIDFYQDSRSLVKGNVYDLTFQAKSSAPRPLTLSAQQNQSPWTGYGLWGQVMLGTSWQSYTVTFEASATAGDARIQFFAGAATGSIWLDDVRLALHPPDVYVRDFTHGLVLLNGTRQEQTVNLGSGFRRLRGQQAPRFEKLLDDSGAGFTTPSGTWSVATADSGEWKATGPFYHSWGGTLHTLSGSQGEARWTLPVTAADTYTIQAWWPAAPQAAAWNTGALFEVVAGGKAVASATLSQAEGGDEWHTIGTVSLTPSDQPFVRLSCQGPPCAADAVYLRSASRYNDGSQASQVTLQPLDGILLERDTGILRTYLPTVLR